MIANNYCIYKKEKLHWKALRSTLELMQSFQFPSLCWNSGILMKAKIGSGQCFSNFNVHTNYPEFLVKMQILIQWFWAGAENLHT